MIKSLGLAALTLSLPFIPAALGCSSSSTGGEVNPGDDASTTHYDSGTGSETSTGNHDSGQTFDGSSSDSSTGDGGGGTCPASVTGYSPATYNDVSVMANVCSSTDISNFVAACGDNGTDTTCGDWQTANLSDGGTSCGNCIFGGVDGSGNALNNGAVYSDPDNFFGPNYAGCVQLVDTTNGAACAPALDNYQGCLGVACDMCDQQSAQDCQTAVQTGACGTYGNAVQSACPTDFNDGGAYNTCTPGGGQTQDPDWTYIINLVCGTGAH